MNFNFQKYIKCDPIYYILGIRMTQYHIKLMIIKSSINTPRLSGHGGGLCVYVRLFHIDYS